MVSVLILGLVFTGCSEIAKFSSPATVNTDGDLERCVECFGPESATGYGKRIIEKKNGGGTWFMYNEYLTGGVQDPDNENIYVYQVQAGNPKDGENFNIIGDLQIWSLGKGWYEAQYWIYPVFTVVDEHLAISDSMNFTGKPGRDDNQDFKVKFFDKNGEFFIFAHFEVECSDSNLR